MPKHEVPLHIQKGGVARAIDILKEIYPARVLQKKDKATREGARLHIKALTAALATLDGLDNHIDMRDDLDPWKGRTGNDDKDRTESS